MTIAIEPAIDMDDYDGSTLHSGYPSRALADPSDSCDWQCQRWCAYFWIFLGFSGYCKAVCCLFWDWWQRLSLSIDPMLTTCEKVPRATSCYFLAYGVHTVSERLLKNYLQELYWLWHWFFQAVLGRLPSLGKEADPRVNTSPWIMVLQGHAVTPYESPRVSLPLPQHDAVSLFVVHR